MKRICIVLTLLLLKSFAHAQDSTIHRVNGSNIMIIGVNHEDGKSLLRENEKNSVGFIFPDLKKLAGKKPMIILTEGMNTHAKVYRVNSDLGWKGAFPSILDTVLMMGGDIRNHTESRLARDRFKKFFDPYYVDTCKKEESFEGTFFTECRFPTEKLTAEERDSFYDASIKFAEINLKFENALIRDAQVLEQEGYYVLLFCGTTHAIRISQRYDWDYVFFVAGLEENVYSMHMCAVADLYSR